MKHVAARKVRISLNGSRQAGLQQEIPQRSAFGTSAIESDSEVVHGVLFLLFVRFDCLELLAIVGVFNRKFWEEILIQMFFIDTCIDKYGFHMHLRKDARDPRKKCDWIWIMFELKTPDKVKFLVN